jgi:hypothetical protein
MNSSLIYPVSYWTRWIMSDIDVPKLIHDSNF